MEIFNLTLSQMLTMFILIVAGYILRKKKILPENAHLAMSRLETYAIVPALYLYSWITNCTPEILSQNSSLIIYGFVLVAIAALLSYPLSMLFIKKSNNRELEYRRNIYKYAMTFGNYGFMGNFLVLSVWGDAMFFKYSMFTMFVSFVCGSWGLIILIPKDRAGKETFMSVLKRIMTPPTVALLVGMIVGLLNLTQYVPSFVMNAFSNASKCMGPIAMLLAGFVIGGYDVKELLSDKKIYVATLMRLIILPAIMMFALRALGTSEEIMTFALIAFATPLGLNTVVYPAAYGGEVKTGASMAVISHVLSVITLPIMYLIFIVLM